MLQFITTCSTSALIKARLVLVTWMEQRVSGHEGVAMNMLDSRGQPKGGGSVAYG